MNVWVSCRDPRAYMCIHNTAVYQAQECTQHPMADRKKRKQTKVTDILNSNLQSSIKQYMHGEMHQYIMMHGHVHADSGEKV